MRPATPHYVVTLENSITYGRHFYSTATLLESVWGIVHSFVMGYGVTNVLHENVTRTYLHRIMAMVSSFFVTEVKGELRYLMMDSETDIFNNAEHTSAHDHLFDLP